GEQATTALSREQAGGLLDQSGTTAGHRPPDAGTTAGHRVPGHRRWPWFLGGGAVLLALGGVLAWRGRTPAMAVVAPTASTMHVNDVVLSEAAQIAAKGHPEDALKLVQAVIDATPKDMAVDPDAYAVKLICLYQKGWTIAFGETLTEARFRGVSAQDLLSNAAYKEMLEKDKVRKKLPDKVRERLLQGRAMGQGAADGAGQAQP
ncbi:MAG TPA: hypothetical protein VFM16_01970, partial [Holophagaceae bacterium]|nr:hypothetical protein [Holophagaceae bacterium]